MDEKNENKNEKKSNKKMVIGLAILLFFLLIPAVVFFGKFSQPENDTNTSELISEEDTADNNDNKKEIENIKMNDVDVEIEEKEMVSENYRVSQVKFGGNVIIENGKSRDTKLEIYQVKSENILSQEDNEPSILISWKTNKEAISNIDYAKNDGKNLVNIAEEGYGFEHSMLLKNMEFSTIYTYRIEAKDKWGNKVNTEYFSAYTGDKSESIFDLITNAVEDVFGWAM